MIKGLTTAALTAAFLVGSAASTWAGGHEMTLRATANSNENDEDYDGLVVFKNYVESASNGAIKVELFIGTQLCSNGAECLAGVADGGIDIYVSTSGGSSGTRLRYAARCVSAHRSCARSPTSPRSLPRLPGAASSSSLGRCAGRALLAQTYISWACPSRSGSIPHKPETVTGCWLMVSGPVR